MEEWGRLVDIFGCRWDEGNIPACAADNMLIAWPSLIVGIQHHFGRVSGLAVLDYGCGGGLFCRKLHTLGNSVVGYEPTAGLREAAQRNVPGEVVISDSTVVLEPPAAYELITAVMVLQFVAEIEPLLMRLASLLRPGGLLLTAVFNPQFVDRQVSDNLLFSEYSRERQAGFMILQPGVRIPVYNRTAQEYRQLAARLGLQEVFYDLPPFSEDFLSGYPMPFSTEYPEFLIQGLAKPIG